MTTFAVEKTDLEAALASARTEASRILEEVNTTQRRLENTSFVGETAEHLAREMDDKMGAFVHATYENVDSLLLLITRHMNVVVTKLGGNEWAHRPVERGGVSKASVMKQAGGNTYMIETEEVADFAREVDASFKVIADCFLKIQSTIADGTPGWHGPEKIATVNAVGDAVTTIVSSPNGVTAVGESLSGLLQDQVALMEA